MMCSPTHVRLSGSAAIAWLLCLSAAHAAWSSVQKGAATDLHAAAEGGHVAQVRALLEEGADPDARDARGRTPLHLTAANGHQATAEALLDGGADVNAKDGDGCTPLQAAEANGHGGMREFLLSKGAHALGPLGGTTHTDDHAALKPTLEFKTLASFEAEIGEAAVLLDSTHVCFFAPEKKAKAAQIIFGYLVKAYGELYKIIGVHTEYKIAVYAFPKGNPHGWGGTSNCSIEYDDSNLNLDEQPEWTKYRKPHVSGYIEEMAHNFVHAAKAQFGWEMIGWSLGAKVTELVAGNPIHTEQVRKTRQVQQETFERYVKGGYVFPADIPANLCDRIHARILIECERAYGRNFWPDFFREIRKERQRLIDAVSLCDADQIRNARYRITVECFDRLPGLNFRERLRRNRISLTTDVKSLHPTDPGWDRRLGP